MRLQVLRRISSAIAVGLFVSAAVLTLCAAPVGAAGGVLGTLRGNVVDQRTGAPIGGAVVSVASGSGTFRQTTDARGFFAFVDLPADTYAVGIAARNYEPLVLRGVTVLGDGTQSIGVAKLLRGLRTIGKVSTRNASSAFQPNQTMDETTFQGARIDQALGETGSTNLNQLVLSAPGVTKNAFYDPSPGNGSNAFSIRGASSIEIGYQFDGVDYRGSTFDENPSQGYLNGVGGGKGGLQVVSGPGDATQGGIGAGVVNIVPGRGSYPGEGFVSFDVSSPWYNHSLAAQYGIATRDGRFSDFFSFRSSRSAPEIAPFGRDAADAGQYFGTSFTYDDDVLNNFYYRFGKNDRQQIQVLTDWLDHRAWANYGGLTHANYYPYDPLSYVQFQTDFNNNQMWGCANPAICWNDPTNPAYNPTLISGQQLKFYQSIIPYLPGVPRSQQPVKQPEQFVYGPTNFLKLGYTRQLSNVTSLNVFFYNWGGLIANSTVGVSSDLTLGSNLPGYNNAGGRKVGFQTQLTTVASQKHTLTLVGKFENGFPYWTQQNYGNTWQGFLGGRSTDAAVSGISPCSASQPEPCYSPSGPRIEDWFLPIHPGAPVSAANPCVGPALDNGYDPTQATSQGCYLYSQLLATGKWNGHLPVIPSTGFNYNRSDFQQWGIGVRDQWTPNARLRADYGLRLDGQNLKWAGPTAYNRDFGNTADIGTGFATLPDSYLHPKVFEPRISLSYLIDQNDSVRMSFGRSASFFYGQTGGTPTNMSNVDPLLFGIPAKDRAAFDPATGNGPACGSGWHGPGHNANGTYFLNPNVFYSGQGTVGPSGYYFKCPNYAESLYWAFDQAYAAPDIGGQHPATYNNWDIEFKHQFRNGWGAKLVGYTRRGYNTYQTVLLAAGLPDPVTGQQTAGTFQVRETGLEKTAGLEFMLTTPDRPSGLSGFLSANYVNSFTDTPPIPGSDATAIAQQFLYESGTIFHAAFLSPLSAVAGIDYKTGNGWTFNPILNFDNGVPFGVGKTAIGFINGVLYSIPTGNLGVATPFAGPGLPNQPYNSTCYDDPAFAGNYFHPKYFACRGNSEPALAGQSLTRPRVSTDFSVQYEHKGVTYGAYVTNVFDNYRAEPSVNQFWQPVATGVGGLQTGKYANAYPVNYDGSPNPLYLTGGRNASTYDQYWLPYQENYIPGRTYRFYLQFKL